MAPIKFTPVPIEEKKKRGKRQKAATTEPKLETTLWAAADKLRGHMDAAEYKHVVLGLIFLKYISDAFEEHQNKLREGIANPESELYLDKPGEREAALEDRDGIHRRQYFLGAASVRRQQSLELRQSF